MALPGKKRIMTAFKINEISGVDVPAQAGARMTLMKRDEKAQDIGKGYLADILTDEVDGHQHGLSFTTDYKDRPTIEISHARAAGSDYSHDHPIARGADGTFMIGVSAGHTHTIDAAAVAALFIAQSTTKNEVTDMTKDTKTLTPDEVQAELTKFKADLEKANKVIALTAGERGHYDNLDEAGKDTFLDKSGDDRKADMDAAKRQAEDKDPVAYTTMDGAEIRKSAGEVVISIAKANDDLRKQNLALKADADMQRLEKRADEEIPHLPGDVKTRAAMLKAMDGIEDEGVKKAALESLKANNEAMSLAYKNHGGAGAGPEAGSPLAELDALANKHAEANKTTFAKAYDEVLRTDKGRELYTATLN